MYSVQKLEEWTDLHHPKWIDLIRVLLGVIIITKGIVFILNREEVINMIRYSSNEFLTFLIAHYVIASFLVGGIAITIGIFTRTASLLQIPALLGSIIMIDFHRNLFGLNSLLIYSVLILFLLLFFTFYGAGIFSIDNYMKRHPE